MLRGSSWSPRDMRESWMPHGWFGARPGDMLFWPKYQHYMHTQLAQLDNVKARHGLCC